MTIPEHKPLTEADAQRAHRRMVDILYAGRYGGQPSREEDLPPIRDTNFKPKVLLGNPPMARLVAFGGKLVSQPFRLDGPGYPLRIEIPTPGGGVATFCLKQTAIELQWTGKGTETEAYGVLEYWWDGSIAPAIPMILGQKEAT